MKYSICLLILLLGFANYAQQKDTVYILFDNRYDIMEKVDYTRFMQEGSPKEKLKKSISYIVQQMEETYPYDNKFKFSHHNQSKKAYKWFGGEPPLILKKPKYFLEGKKMLDIEFFRTTPYIQIVKTFEAEDSWEQDVIIFMIDVDEIKNDNIILREVTFRRPVKQ